MARFKNILLTGVNGQVGHELQHTLSVLGHAVALDRSQLDLTDVTAIRSVVRAIKPDIIINPAAYTAVDKAESEPELAFAINATAPAVLAEEAKKLGAMLVHYSTDYVFDGTKSAAYVETDATNPLSIYGKSKLAGEEAIREVNNLPHLILRTSWVYGGRGKNFLRTILRLASEREQLRVVSDQIGAPTWSRTIAEATASALLNWDEGKSGTYHLTNSGETSWHGFAQAIVEEYQLLHKARGWPALKVSNIEAITTSDYPTPAPRPGNSRLNGAKFSSVFSEVMSDWRESLKEVLNDPEFRPI
ncbi:MAG TPA: dTDP-4-dehydrorhamnose reductase [Methylophilaceae bacterium]|jgi:dTDP-4-dehydrorhamnose reductase